MHRFRFVLVALMCATVLSLATATQAASGFADSAFKQQWQQGEAITQNFWGPLETARDGQQEPYKEAQGGQRLVQYFDKGRMELTNGTVTNGLLATEIIRGQIQAGDSIFQPQAPPNIAIAGDSDNPAPTYAGLASKGGTLLQKAGSTPGAPVTSVIGSDGNLSSGSTGSDSAMVIGAFDDATGHNVAAAFVDYRGKAGLATIGFAISEPFRATVKVGGQSKDVMIQVFERRVLTYTASNPDAFKVEMGNIGQHYFTWRYPNGAPPTSPPTGSTTTPAGSQSQIDLKGSVVFKAPDTWKLDPGSTPTLIKLNGPTATEQLTVTVRDQANPPTTTLDDELNAYIAAVHKIVSKFSDEMQGPTMIGGEQARAYRFSGVRANNTPISGVFVIAFHNGKAYTFETLADTAVVLPNSNIPVVPDYNDLRTIVLPTVTFT